MLPSIPFANEYINRIHTEILLSPHTTFFEPCQLCVVCWVWLCAQTETNEHALITQNAYYLALHFRSRQRKNNSNHTAWLHGQCDELMTDECYLSHFLSRPIILLFPYRLRRERSPVHITFINIRFTPKSAEFDFISFRQNICKQKICGKKGQS